MSVIRTSAGLGEQLGNRKSTYDAEFALEVSGEPEFNLGNNTTVITTTTTTTATATITSVISTCA